MNVNRTRAVAALTAAGLAWGSSVPLSKVALDWLAPGWLTVIRFALAAAAALAVVPRPKLRAAFTPAVLVSGAVGYGGCILAQNAGLARTSVTDAALLIGASPVVVAVITAAWHRTVARPVAWAGFVLSLAGVVLVAGGGGAGAGAAGVGMGDALVLVSVLLSAGMTVAQGGLLENRDPVAVSAVQFLGAALAALPFAAAEGVPAAPPGAGPVLAVAALTAAGTLLPFTLFAYGQRRVPPQIAGAFLNLEPLVGALAGIIVFGDPAGLPQLAGGTAILAGIGMGSMPMFAGQRKTRLAGSPWPKRISHPPRTSRPARCRSSCSGTTPVPPSRTGSAAMRRYPGSSQACACWTQVSGGYLTGGRAARRNPPRPRTCGAASRSRTYATIAPFDHPGLVVAESDEDLLPYETGHVPGAVKPDWHAELSAPVTRDYADGVGFARLMSDKGHPDVRLMDGGRAKWLAEGRAVSTKTPERKNTDYPVVEPDDTRLRAYRETDARHVRDAGQDQVSDPR